jgi:hypothetical protein
MEYSEYMYLQLQLAICQQPPAHVLGDKMDPSPDIYSLQLHRRQKSARKGREGDNKWMIG